MVLNKFMKKSKPNPCDGIKSCQCADMNTFHDKINYWIECAISTSTQRVHNPTKVPNSELFHEQKVIIVSVAKTVVEL